MFYTFMEIRITLTVVMKRNCCIIGFYLNDCYISTNITCFIINIGNYRSIKFILKNGMPNKYLMSRYYDNFIIYDA